MAPRFKVISHRLSDLTGLKFSLFLTAPPGLLTVLLAAVDNGLLVLVDDMVSGFVEVTVKSVSRSESCPALPALVAKSVRGPVRCRLTVGDRHVDHNL
jgi:hypothetical protein